MECNSSDDPYACGWVAMLTSRGDPTAMFHLADADVTDLDAEMRLLFPALAGKELIDEAVPVPPAITFKYLSYEPYSVSLPVDWSADPHHNRTWQMELQSLAWLKTSTPDDLSRAAAIVADWGERAYAEGWTWYDAAMAKRLDAVGRFFTAYTASSDRLNRRVVVAATRIILSHLFALSTTDCYTAKDNHGMMQNIAVLRNAHLVAHLRGGAQLWSDVLARTRAHVARSVTADGIHVEHSPDYQVVYLGLVLDTIDAIRAAAQEVPADLIGARDRLIGGLVYLIQPNHTLVQFGDTENDDVRNLLGRMVKQARAQGGGDSTVLDQLEWILSDGARGAPPQQVDRVFEQGGYAAFRNSWNPGDDQIAAHFISNHLSSSHYHADDGSFELYGFGKELVVDSGKYDYEYTDTRSKYAASEQAHNGVVVDDRNYEQDLPPVIAAHAETDTLSWVRASYHDYDFVDVHDQARTFALAKPAAVVLVDEALTSRPHAFAQHFHLHPSLSTLHIDGNAAIAESPDGGPSLVIVALTDASSITKAARSWYFPAWEMAEDNIDVVIHHDDDPPGTQTFAALVIVVPPGVSPTAPTDARFDAGTRTANWTINGESHEVRLP